MSGEPQIEHRAEQPYAGIRLRVTMDGMPGEMDRGFPELFGWLAEHGVTPAGPPFIRYHVIDMDRELDVELGCRPTFRPTAEPASGRGFSRPDGTRCSGTPGRTTA